MSRTALLYLASLCAHGLLAVSVLSLDGERRHEAVSISMVQRAKPAPAPPPAPPTLPPPPDSPKVAAKAKAAPPKAAPADAPAPVAAGAGSFVPDFGVSMSGASGGGGLAIPAAREAQAAPAPTVERSKKVLTAAPPAEIGCTEVAIKPKVLNITQPAYTREGREAQVSGKVRVELTVDADGHVASARVLDGLGYGLDEAAIAAARSATFEPATRCGKPVSATFVIGMRFSL